MKNLFDISGRVAVVTGASSGLGMQFAKMFVEQGAKVALLARRLDRLNSLASELSALDGDVLPVQCDVTSLESVEVAVNNVKNHFGRIDILVNNAGIAKGGKAEEVSLDDWKAVIDANLNGVFTFSREVGKVMISQKYGKIVNVGSIHSNLAISASVHGVASYCASKGGVQMLTKSLAAEWAQHNITVNAIGPSYFLSEMTQRAASAEEFTKFVASRCPMGRMGREGELNGAVLYFSSDASSFTTGQLLNIDGGWNTI